MSTVLTYFLFLLAVFQDNVCHDKYSNNSGLKHAAGETLAELETREHELFNVEAVINSRSYKVSGLYYVNLIGCVKTCNHHEI